MQVSGAVHSPLMHPREHQGAQIWVFSKDDEEYADGDDEYAGGDDEYAGGDGDGRDGQLWWGKKVRLKKREAKVGGFGNVNMTMRQLDNVIKNEDKVNS